MAKKQITYNEAIKEINEILTIIENDDIDVDVITEKVKRACFLIKFCKDKLHTAEEEIEKLFKELEQ
jgi:exodeoxyribonuclease VII small subunit